MSDTRFPHLVHVFAELVEDVCTCAGHVQGTSISASSAMHRNRHLQGHLGKCELRLTQPGLCLADAALSRRWQASQQQAILCPALVACLDPW